MEEKLKEIGVTKFQYKLIEPMTYQVSVTAPKSVSNSDIANVLYMNRLTCVKLIGLETEIIKDLFCGLLVEIRFDRFY